MYKEDNDKELEGAMNDAESGDDMEGTANKESQGSEIIEMITEDSTAKIVLFHDEFKDPYMQITVGEHRELWSCKSKMCRRWIARSYWRKRRKAARAEGIKTALTVIEGKACFDGPMIHLANRITEAEGAIWYDLSDPEWRAVKVTKEGWEVVKNPPILFRRYSHQKAQSEPVHEGDVTLLFKYLNVSDKEQQLLLLVWLISCFVPNIPHPILIIYGAQGSSKTVFCRLMKKVVDPSVVETTGFPRDINGLIQLLAHHWCIAFDNVSYLPHDISDELCKAVTGGGLSKRELYSDDDDVLYTIRRCLIINGINLVATKPDILERGILLELERISEEKRMSEGAMIADFEKDLPGILGGIFSVLQKSLQIEPSIKLSSMPRMADFARWGCAIAQALGQPQERFLAAYQTNINRQNDEVLAESLIAWLIISFMEKKDDWEGTPTALRNALIQEADDNGATNIAKDRDFPRSANVLGKRVNELRTNLATKGLYITRGKEKKRRYIYIRNDRKDVGSVGSVAPSSSTEATSPQKDSPSLFGPKTDKGDERDDSNKDPWDPETF